MFASLRSRLWLSYALVVGIVLIAVFLGLIIALQRTPLFYRQTMTKIRQAEVVLVPKLQNLVDQPQDKLEKYLQKESATRELRFVIIRKNGKVLSDTLGESSNLPEIIPPDEINTADPTTFSTFRDGQGKRWIYTLDPIDNRFYLMTTVEWPVISLRNLLRDEIVSPILQAGLISLIAALLISFLMARWIVDPLSQMAKSARMLSSGEIKPIIVQGPSEIRLVADDFNQMVTRLNNSLQAQRDLIANISHELKTPLTSIQGFAQAIQEGITQSPDELHQAATVIYNESSRMSRLVMDLMTLSKLETGTANLQRHSVDFTIILRNVVAKFKPQSEKAQINLIAEIPVLPVSIGDGDRLVQVFTNLVDNAIKFTPAGGMVQVRARSIQQGIKIFISDNGAGIPLEDQQRIFERFYQVDKSRRGGRERGVGLGLAIAKQIVMAHGGQISVESSPGKGTTFVVKLPLSLPGDETLNVRKL
jgi:signal transduction histidine kinase